MKLYYSKGACSLAVRIIIHELELKCRYEAVNLQNKKTETGEDFLTINPKGAVPTLITADNQILTENAVIQQYLADTHNAITLFPPIPDFRRYRVLEWLNFISTELHKGFGPLFNSQLEEEIKNKIFIPQLKKKLNYVDEQLTEKKFLMGDQFTLPDSYLFVILYWANKFKLDLTNCQHLNRYFKELKNRKSIQQALAEESLS